MSEASERLRQARKDAGFRSARAAALKFGWKPSTYASHENGQTPEIPHEAARDYARAFKVSPGWLLTGEGSKRRQTGQLIGYVGAGDQIFPFDGELGEETELPPGTPPNLAAVKVRGHSMHPRYKHGEVIFYANETRAPDELIGEECIVRLADGRMLVKTIRKGSRRNRFNLESYNAPLLEDQRIEWAARVRWRG
jgi:phage repressor protein C with HTH and peptisase S24 domain